jgi:hypothetical protein
VGGAHYVWNRVDAWLTGWFPELPYSMCNSSSPDEKAGAEWKNVFIMMAIM